MSIKIDRIDLQKGDYVFIKFAGSAEHSLTISWLKKDDLPTVSGPFNCKSKNLKYLFMVWSWSITKMKTNQSLKRMHKVGVVVEKEKL